LEIAEVLRNGFKLDDVVGASHRWWIDVLILDNTGFIVFGA
jgi:hypothetical protein